MKNSHQFRVGDVVKLTRSYPSIRYKGPEVGAIGVIVHLVGSVHSSSYSIRWDKAFNGGHAGNNGRDNWSDSGHGWYVPEGYFRYAGRRVNPKTILERK